MAEAIGLVAGGINIATLAGQALKSAVKIKEYWNQIHDAPEEVQDLLDELDLLCRLLADMEVGIEHAHAFHHCAT